MIINEHLRFLIQNLENAAEKNGIVGEIPGPQSMLEEVQKELDKAREELLTYLENYEN